MQEKARVTKKKKAPTVFATDIKGKVVWTLRGASPEDTGSVAELVPILPREVVETLVEDSEGCTTVCEASVKGTKEGEGYKSRIFGVALADVRLQAKESDEEVEDPTFVKKGELVTVKVSDVMPEGDSVKEKLTLGCMRKLKSAQCVDVFTTIKKSSTEYRKTLKGYGFVETPNEDTMDDYIDMTANLGNLNPDPQKRML